jgi:hypothetical protein
MGETLDVGIVFGFDHDAGELLRAGVTKNDAAVFAEDGIGFAESADNFREGFERGLGFYLYVDDGLRIVLEAGNKRIEAAFESNERSDFDGGEKTVTGGRIIQKNDVAGLFTAEDAAALEHFFENVAIADVGTSQRNIFMRKDAFETEVGHGSGDDAITRKFILGYEITRDPEKYSVTVDDFSIGRNEEGSVCVAIEGDSEGGAFGRNTLLQLFKMKRTASGIDVAAVGFRGDANDVAAERGKKFRSKLIGGAIRTIKNDAKTFKVRAGNYAGAEKIEILMMQRIIRTKIWQSSRWFFGSQLENSRFDFFLNGIGKFHTFVRKKFDSIVLIRIV